jgi:autotransporter family porin
MTEFYHFSSLGDFVSRRGQSADQHFSLQDYTWMYGGGLTGQFDLNNASSFDGTAYFARFGIDVIQPMESMRIGFTSSAGRAMTDANKGSADADIYSVGGYVSYVTPQFYADLLGEFSWGRWDIGVPNQPASLDVTTYVVSGEVGTTVKLSKTLNLVPNAQLVFLRSNFDGVAFNNVNVGFDSDDSVIGRLGARFQYDASQAVKGAHVYLGVGREGLGGRHVDDLPEPGVPWWPAEHRLRRIPGHCSAVFGWV